MDAAAPLSSRCPRCAAFLRPGAPWCTLCYADLRPASDSEPVAVTRALAAVGAVAPAPVRVDPLTAPLAQVVGPARGRVIPAPDAPSIPATPSIPTASAAPAPPVDPASVTWPCATCDHDNPLAADRCVTCGNAFLSSVHGADGPLLTLPGVGDVLELSRAKRLALGAGVVLACVLLTALLGVITG